MSMITVKLSREQIMNLLMVLDRVEIHGHEALGIVELQRLLQQTLQVK